VTFLSDYWASIVQLRTQLNIIETKYPVAIKIIPQDGTAEDLNTSTSSTSAVLATVPSFKATVKIVNLVVRSKTLISFLFDFGVFAHWPMALKKTRCEAEVLVGPFKCVFSPARSGPQADARLVVRKTFARPWSNTSHRSPPTKSMVASWMPSWLPSRGHDRHSRDIIMTLYIYILYRYNRS